MPQSTSLSALESKSLLAADIYDSLASRLQAEYGHDRGKACRIVDETVRFLVLCATNPTRSFAPSIFVDQGWHTFILDTRAYAEFCDRIAGTFLHHHPTDGPVSGPGLPTATDTAAFMTRAGISHDAALWGPAAAATCWPPSMDAEAPADQAPGEGPAAPICIWLPADPAAEPTAAECIWAPSEQGAGQPAPAQ
jgi:hypothetical protein